MNPAGSFNCMKNSLGIHGEPERARYRARPTNSDKPFLSLMLAEPVEKTKDQEDVKNIVGILFAQPNKDLVKNDILANIDYANERSGKYIDFFFAGYSKHSIHGKNETIIDAPKGKKWYYSAEMFNDFIEEIEKISKWKYSGETELLLIEYGDGKLYFDKCISVWLEKAVKEGSIHSVSSFFEDVYRIAHKETEVSAFSNKLALKKGSASVIGSVIAFLDTKLGGVITATKNFRVQNFSK